MRYGCDDIKYYLENSEIGPHDETEFLRHIENCGECNRLIDLTPDLERLIYMSSPKPSPLSFEKDILIELNRYEAELSGEGVWEKVETRGLVLLAAAPVILALWFWKDIRAVFGSLDFGTVIAGMRSLAAEIPTPAIDFSGILQSVANSPLAILSLVSLTAIIWAFSIIEFRNALR